MPRPSVTQLAIASFLGFGALLVLYGANASALIQALALDYADLGLLGSMLSLGLGVGIVGAGPIIDRSPRRPLYLAAVAVVSGATLAVGPGTTLEALLALTFLIGLGAGFYETVLNALIVEAFADRAPKRLVFVHAAATAAASATPLVLAGARELVAIPWYDTFRMAGVAHGALLVIGALVPMHDPPRHAARDQAPGAANPAAGQGATDDRLALGVLCAATFAYVGVEAAISLFVADHTTSTLGLDASRAARAISGFWGGLLVGRLAIGLTPRPVGAGTIAGLACGAVVTMAAFGSGGLASPEIAMALCGLFLGGVFPVMIGLAGLTLPSGPGVAVGLAGGLGSLGGFVIPWVTGRIANGAGLGLAMTSLSAWLVALVLAAAFVSIRRRQRARA